MGAQKSVIFFIMWVTQFCHMTEMVHFSTLAMADSGPQSVGSWFSVKTGSSFEMVRIPGFLPKVLLTCQAICFNRYGPSARRNDGSAGGGSKRHTVPGGPVPAEERVCGDDMVSGRPWPTRVTGGRPMPEVNRVPSTWPRKYRKFGPFSPKRHR